MAACRVWRPCTPCRVVLVVQQGPAEVVCVQHGVSLWRVCGRAHGGTFAPARCVQGATCAQAGCATSGRARSGLGPHRCCSHYRVMFGGSLLALCKACFATSRVRFRQPPRDPDLAKMSSSRTVKGLRGPAAQLQRPSRPPVPSTRSNQSPCRPWLPAPLSAQLWPSGPVSSVFPWHASSNLRPPLADNTSGVLLVCSTAAVQRPAVVRGE